MKLTVITPCFNAEALIDRTVASVIGAASRASSSIRVEYILCDGGSRDATVARAKALMDARRPSNLEFRVLTEPDQGMYDALSKGLVLADGDLCAYINAGDFYSSSAFEIIAEVFSDQRIKWLTGLQVEYNDMGHLNSARLPYRFRRRLIQRGCYDGITLPYLQQESTFWRAELNQTIDLKKLREFRLAGDYYLWTCFSQLAEPMVVEAWLGGFAFHKGQKSEDRSGYMAELRSVVLSCDFLSRLRAVVDRFIWSLPRAYKWRLGEGWLLVFDREVGCYRAIRG